VPSMSRSLPQRAGEDRPGNDRGPGPCGPGPRLGAVERAPGTGLVSVRCRERQRACRSASPSRRRRWRRSGEASHRARGRGAHRRAAHRPTGARPSGRPGLRNGHNGPRRSATRSSGQLQWSHRPHFSNGFGIGLNVARGWEHSRNPPGRRVVRHLDPIMLTRSPDVGISSLERLHQPGWKSLVLSVTGAARVRFKSAELGPESSPHRDVAHRRPALPSTPAACLHRRPACRR